MKVNPLWLEQISGEEEYQAGREIEESGRIRISEQDGTMIRYLVSDEPARMVTLTRSLRASCGCESFLKKGCCRHLVAAVLEAERNNIPNSFLKISAPQRGEELTGLIAAGMPMEANLQMEVTLALPRTGEEELLVGFRVGMNKLYVVRDIRAFLYAKEMEESMPFGRDFTYEPSWMRFSEADEAILRLVQKMFVSRDTADRSGAVGAVRMLKLPQLYAAELLELMSNRPFRIMLPDGGMIRCRQIREIRIPMQFAINLHPRGINITGRMPAEFLPLTRDCEWGILNGEAVHVEKDQTPLLGLIWQHQYDGKCLFDYTLKDTERVIGEVLPYLKLRGAVEMGEDLRRRLVKRSLKTEIYLDKDGKSIVAAVRFRYGEIELNPFGPVTEKIALDKGEKLLLREAEAEHKVLEILARSGFLVRKDHIRLSGTDAVYDFVSEGVHRLQEVSEVFLSREFKRILPRRPTLSGSMRMNGEQLELMLETDGEPTEETLGLLEALSRKRRYFRLKSGTFLDLSDLGEWQETAASIYEAAVRDGNDLNRDVIVLRAYRAVYLSSMLEKSGAAITLDETVDNMRRRLDGGQEVTAPALAPGMSLRDYQRRGYEWMFALDQMHMGGILADDMGLGKTVQVIALLESAKQDGRTSLVVAPTSLTYNWLSEIRRFAPHLSAVTLSGSGAQRAALIRHAMTNGDVDVIITSYPLIRRDIEVMKDYVFRFVILDEAQNIKNAGSVAAVAVKRLQADSRFALTGTPMENGVGELWSLFDFVLPGYLPGYNTFVRRYQDGENAEDLLRRIRPFLTRRLKQDVLEELPDKLEHTMVARMTAEQEKVYRAALERLRPQVNRIMQEKGINRGRVEVLSAIMELREICCHPSLVLDGYRGESGKEELLMEILPALVAAGRRILLFSQFTSMLKLLRTRLESNGYSTLYLDGETPAGERIRLTEQFNGGEGEIFLISLRAGGSGLNLTGADTVIHYDPWWNPATEDQATDRAHRIGQTHKVQVIRLVTGESIEEQVVELGARKKALFDRLITPGEAEVSGLSDQDIRNLFS